MNNVYDRTTIRFHWWVAGIILTLWTLGQCIDFFPKGDPRIFARSVHILLGATLMGLYLLRLRWRMTSGTKLPPADPGTPGKVAIGVHHLLYLLLGCVLLAGMTAAWFRGDTLFHLFQIPALFSQEDPWREEIVDLHGLLANSLFAVALLHAAAALWHHFIRKDNVLRRMWPGIRP